ncbi:hypothetical protein CLOP_g3479 [Closterium sp. NIES-67]|nr:hypothetical protein CLOP_g3479 [Closterium sp. NIES-67]
MQRVVDMPEDSQKVLLDGMGQALVSSGMWPCNIFGGVKACVAVPSNGSFMQQCTNIAKSEVDCAYNLETLSDINEDPNVIMKEKLQEAGFEPCPACLDALHRFWCGQTTPTCGTFAKVVDEILPEMRQVSAGRMKPDELIESTPEMRQVSAGRMKPDELIEASLPRMLQAFSLGLPCRKMCEAVTATCSCGRPATFGQMMKVLELKRTQQQAEAEGAAGRPLAENKDLIPFGFSTNMSLATAVKIFKGVWDRPVCDLFAPHDAPGFQGVCETWWAGADKNQTTCHWCESKQRPEDMDEQIVAQIAQSVSSMMQAGLEHVLFAAAFPVPALNARGAQASSSSSASSASASASNAGPVTATASAGASTAGAGGGAAAGTASPAVTPAADAADAEAVEKAEEEVEREEQKDFNWQDDQTGLPDSEPVELPPETVPPELIDTTAEPGAKPAAAEPGAEPTVQPGPDGPGFFREAAPGDWGYKASDEVDMAKMMRGEGGGEREGEGATGGGGTAGGGWKQGGSTKGGTMMRGERGEGEGTTDMGGHRAWGGKREGEKEGEEEEKEPSSTAISPEDSPRGHQAADNPPTMFQPDPSASTDTPTPATEATEPERPPVWEKKEWQEKREEPEGGWKEKPEEPAPEPAGNVWYRGHGDDLPIPPTEEKRGSPLVATFFIFFAAAGVVGGLAFWKMRRERRVRDGGLQYIDLQEMSYRPPEF